MSLLLPGRAASTGRGGRGLSGLVALVPLALLGSASCAGGDDLTRAPQPIVTAADPTPPVPPPLPTGRLPGTASPLRYALSLAIDPEKDRFTGDVTITLDVPKATRAIVLHGRDLTIGRAEVLAEGQPIAVTPSARASAGQKEGLDELVLTLARPLRAGKAELRIAYSAEISDKLSGLYRVREGEGRYVFTQLEPTEARRVLPCFDEPSFKVPLELKVTVPKGNLVVANGEEAERTPSEDGKSLTFRFTPTAPLPTYLFALAAGPLEVREGARSPVKIRLVTTKGKAAQGDLVLEAAAAHTELLAAYFDRPFPYQKLDLLAVPEFGFGAMENAGLIAFREELILLDLKGASTAARQKLAANVAHEISHHWFGNLVTMPWWDDLWLNEGFATMMESRIVDAWRPELGLGLDALRAKAVVMGRDALGAARAVRTPVATSSEAEEAFDEITYDKGAAVFAMLEGWLGKDVFQQGIRGYLKAHEHGNASAAELFSALSSTSGKDIARVAGTFLDQPGVPLLRAEIACDKGKPPLVKLRQERYRPKRAGVDTASGGEARWSVPYCLRHEGGEKSAPLCGLLDAASAEVPLGVERCPRWVHPNAEQSGYYRFALPPAETRALFAAARALDPRSRLGVIDNAWALVQSGDLGADRLIDLLSGLRGERSRAVVEQMIAALDAMDRTLVDDAARPAFRRLVSSLLLPLGKQLGWDAKKTDTDDQRLLRRSVLAALSTLAEDPWLDAEADRRARKYLADPRSVDPDIAAIALSVSSRRAGETRFDELLAASRKATSAADRVVAVSALGSFADPILLRHALDRMLGDQIKLADSFYVFNAAMTWAASRPTVLGWVKEHFAELKTRMPDFLVARLSSVVASICDAGERQESARFFTEGLRATEGAERALALALETVDGCVDLRAREGARLKKRLGRP
ncbi:MAG: M1 family metallopeptidase [Byssovorax sp.]